MVDNNLIEIFNTGEHVEVRVQYNKKTGELYVNDRKVVTEVGLTNVQKFFAYAVSVSIIVQGFVAVLTYFN